MISRGAEGSSGRFPIEGVDLVVSGVARGDQGIVRPGREPAPAGKPASSLFSLLPVFFRDGRQDGLALDFRNGFIDHGVMEIHFTTQILKEGRTFVAHTPELDVSSCGGTKERAVKNLKEAVRLFLEEAEKLGTLERILEEAGYLKRRSRLEGPKFIGTQRVSLPLPMAHAKA